VPAHLRVAAAVIGMTGRTVIGPMRARVTHQVRRDRNRVLALRILIGQRAAPVLIL
jgi:hypothetical protein